MVIGDGGRFALARRPVGQRLLRSDRRDCIERQCGPFRVGLQIVHASRLLGNRSADPEELLPDLAEFLLEPIDPFGRASEEDEENANQDQRQQFEH